MLVYTQADAETNNLYMKVLRGFNIPGSTFPDRYVLKICKNIYGQKQAGQVWNKHLVSKPKPPRFKQRSINECVFYQGSCIYMLYTNNSILAGPDKQELDNIIQDMKALRVNLDRGRQYFGFPWRMHQENNQCTVCLTQPHLIDQILRDLRLDKEIVVTKQTPALVSTILSRFSESESFDGHFKYQSIIRKLNYLEKSTQPDISYAVHQCAQFAANPKKGEVTWLGRYLAATKDKGLIFFPTAQSFDCYVDANFSGNWDKKEAQRDPDTARSQLGHVIVNAGCPIVWASKLQTQIALSTTKAEYIALRYL
jgi:hypothetical protein